MYHREVLYNTVQFRAIQYSTIQYTVQCSARTVQCKYRVQFFVPYLPGVKFPPIYFVKRIIFNLYNIQDNEIKVLIEALIEV